MFPLFSRNTAWEVCMKKGIKKYYIYILIKTTYIRIKKKKKF